MNTLPEITLQRPHLPALMIAFKPWVHQTESLGLWKRHMWPRMQTSGPTEPLVSRGIEAKGLGQAYIWLPWG